MRFALVLAIVFASSLVSSAQSGLTYRVIDGDIAKRIDNYCATLWLPDDEVLLIEYRGRTYMLRTTGGNIGRGCKVDH